jgi:hypothetical protein
MYNEENKRVVLQRLLASANGEITVFFGNHQQTGVPKLKSDGVILKWTVSDGMQKRKGKTFIFYEDITAISN